MAAHNPAQEKVTQQLLDAVARMRDDMRRVELWAGAVQGFARPIPEYRALDQHQLRPSESERTSATRCNKPSPEA